MVRVTIPFGMVLPEITNGLSCGAEMASLVSITEPFTLAAVNVGDFGVSSMVTGVVAVEVGFCVVVLADFGAAAVATGVKATVLVSKVAQLFPLPSTYMNEIVFVSATEDFKVMLAVPPE